MTIGAFPIGKTAISEQSVGTATSKKAPQKRTVTAFRNPSLAPEPR
jgi:hypothetical protein